MLSLALAVLLAFGLFAGCGGDSGTASPTPPTSTPGATPTPSGDDQPAARFPLVDQSTALTIWRSWSSTFLTDPNEMICYQLIEEKTNVHIDWTCVARINESELFNLMVVSGIYTDMIFAMDTTYVGGIDRAIADGVFIDANPYLNLAPTFDGLRQGNDLIRKLTTTDLGAVFFSNIQSGEQPAFIGPMVRADWLEDLNIASPRSYDDWKNMLIAFRDELGVAGSFWPGVGGINGKIHNAYGFGMISGYGVGNSFYNQDGIVKYGPIEDGFREYLAMLVEWSAEGLLYQDWFSVANPADELSAIVSGKAGASQDSLYTYREIARSLQTDPGFRWESARIPSKDGNSISHFRRVNDLVGTTIIFPTTGAVSRNVAELCVKWLDARYTEEIAFILNYGEEGVNWELGGDGIPHYTEAMNNDPDYSFNDLVGMISDSTHGAYYMWIREVDQYEPETVAGEDIWMESASGDWVLPNLSLTDEEAADHRTIIGDVETYVEEFIVAVIVGHKELNDTTWNEYVDWIKNIGIENSIRHYQAALDRWMVR
ncbi:MAG: hypothetical protein LBL09_04155 [Oscillospiraceae bacterium]|nr:hypothetical protein [Oscillospiraceae bacterium]